MLKRMDRLYQECAEHWCHFAHTEFMWPVNGQYRCRTCFRTYPVPWANGSEARAPRRFSAAHSHTKVDRPKAA